MKHAGSVHILCWMLRSFILFSFIGLYRTLTPPRILYGGWTPILPGHPFYFGPIQTKNLEQSYPHQNLPLGRFFEPPAHEVEHHTEHHLQFVNPKQHKKQDIHQPPIKSQHTYDEHKIKDIFSYYPPQSAYDTQRHPNYEHKPAYFEVPRKPMEVYRNPHLHVSSLKNVPIRNLNLPLHHDENAYLKVNTLSSPNTLKHIGQLNAKQIQHLPFLKQLHPIKDISGVPNANALLYSKYKIPTIKQNYKTRHPEHIQSGIAEVTYNTLQYPVSHNMNSYKSNKFQQSFNPIETKYFNSHITTPNIQGLKQDITSNQKLYLNKKHLPLNQPNIPNSQIYSTNNNLYSNQKPLIGLNKNLISPSSINKHVTNQITYFPKISHHSSIPFYPTSIHKPLYKTAVYPYTTSKDLHLKTGSRHASPQLLKNYLHKNVKLHTLYKNPSIVTNIQGSPAIVEREVAIIHVPVDSESYADGRDYFYHTASTPKSTQILDIVKINESVPYVTLNKHIPVLKNNESYTRITLDYGKGQNLAHVTFVEPVIDGQVHPLFQGINSIVDQQNQYIYVSNQGIGAPILHDGSSKNHNKLLSTNGPEAKKQFFHAYYASANHIPPEGYVKMTIEKFKHFFKNAEIRYVDNDPQSIMQNNVGNKN